MVQLNMMKNNNSLSKEEKSTLLKSNNEISGLYFYISDLVVIT
jgi:hypothetical protein